MSGLEGTWGAVEVGLPDGGTIVALTRAEPPEYPEGLATCDNCGWVEHTPEQLAECIDSMLGPGREPDE